MIRIVLLTLGFWVIGNFAYLLGHLVAGMALGQKIEEFAVFYGPGGVRFKVAGIPVRIGTLPLGGYVKFGDAEQQWTRLGTGKKLLVLLAAPVSGSLYAALCLGPIEAVNSLCLAFPQIINGSLDHAYAIRMLHGYFELFQRHNYLTAAGTVAVKMVAVNLLPFPVVTGGLILMELVRAVARRWIERPVESELLKWTLLVFVILIGSWCVALVQAVKTIPQ